MAATKRLLCYQHRFKALIVLLLFVTVICYLFLNIARIQYLLPCPQETNIYVVVSDDNINTSIQPLKPANYTECEDTNLGYTWLENEFLFQKIILCGPPSNISENIWKSKGYSLIECYRSNNRSQIKIQFCRQYNVYGYLVKYPNTNNYYINYQPRCIPDDKHWSNRYQYGWNALWGIYTAFNKRNKQIPTLPKHNISYIDNKIWFVENNLQCNDGNLWHCAAQIMIMNAIQTYFGDNKIDTKYVMNYGSSTFNTENVVYAHIASIFDTYLVQPIPKNQLSKYPELGEHFRIREVRYNPNPWNTLLWLQDQWKKCQHEDTQRSPLLLEYRTKYIEFCEHENNIITNDWIIDIAVSMDNMYRIAMNGKVLKDNILSHVYGNNNDILSKEHDVITNNIIMDMADIETLQYKISMNEIKIMFIATRWLFDIKKGSMLCSHRCLTNIEQLWQGIIQSFDNHWVVIFGNLAMLSHNIQYNLMRNTDVMIGVHGAVFSWSLIFNSYKKGQKLFEISIPSAPLHSEHWVRMLNIKGYHEHKCTDCCFQRLKDWHLCKHSRVNVTIIVNALYSFVTD